LRFAYRNQGLLAVALAAACAVGGAPARADDAPPSVIDSVPALAPIGDFKKALADCGLTLQMTYIGEVLGNPTGGARQGAAYEGRLDAVLEADMGKVANLTGGTLHAEGYWIHGTGLSRYYLNNLLDVSFIEALPTVRLYELWYEQKLLNDKLSIRFGQLGADTDFVSSKYAQLFVNAITGWPGIFSADMPSGGPAYPFSAPAVRAKYDFSDNFTYVVGVYDGDPAGPGSDDPQRRNRYGVNFRLSDPPLIMQEAQIKYNQDKDSQGLAGTIKLGAWQHVGAFKDMRYDLNGQPFGLTGLPAALHGGDFGFYGMIDQQLVKAPGDPTKGLGYFLRVFGAPGDRNVSDFYFDTGFNLSGFIPGRDNDVAGLSFGYMHVSDRAAQAAIDAGSPARPDYEALLEATYQAQIVPGFSVQPLAQYIFHPGARLNGVATPNALVLGVRSTVAF
jgi:porin